MQRVLPVSLIVFLTLSGCTKQPDDNTDIPFLKPPDRSENASARWFQDESGRYGLQDQVGREILPPTFDAVSPFAEGLAAVNVGATWEFPGLPEGGQWGYVNASGELVIAHQFESAADFSDGLARVSSASETGALFIDSTGDVRLRIPEGQVGDFREGLVAVQRSRSSGESSLITDYLDKSDATLFSLQGSGQEFHDGLAVFTVRGGTAQSNENWSYGYIDRTGKVVIEPIYAEAMPFHEGLAAVRIKKTTVYGMGDSWGYIDRSGQMIIEPAFNQANEFHDGKALVHEGGELMEVLDAPCYWEGGTWWQIDKQGHRVSQVRESSG